MRMPCSGRVQLRQTQQHHRWPFARHGRCCGTSGSPCHSAAPSSAPPAANVSHHSRPSSPPHDGDTTRRAQPLSKELIGEASDRTGCEPGCLSALPSRFTRSPPVIRSHCCHSLRFPLLSLTSFTHAPTPTQPTLVSPLRLPSVTGPSPPSAALELPPVAVAAPLSPPLPQPCRCSCRNVRPTSCCSLDSTRIVVALRAAQTRDSESTTPTRSRRPSSGVSDHSGSGRQQWLAAANAVDNQAADSGAGSARLGGRMASLRAAVLECV